LLENKKKGICGYGITLAQTTVVVTVAEFPVVDATAASQPFPCGPNSSANDIVPVNFAFPPVTTKLPAGQATIQDSTAVEVEVQTFVLILMSSRPTDMESISPCSLVSSSTREQIACQMLSAGVFFFTFSEPGKVHGSKWSANAVVAVAIEPTTIAVAIARIIIVFVIESATLKSYFNEHELRSPFFLKSQSDLAKFLC